MFVSIIGTAGRNDKVRKRLTPELYSSALFKADEYILGLLSQGNLTLKDITLVSGGSSWIDHIAVELFFKYLCKAKVALPGKEYIEGLKLILHLPCEFDDVEYKFKKCSSHMNSNCHTTLNFLHRCFSEKCSIDSLSDISLAVEYGAEIKIYDGFFARNLVVGECQHLLAFTFEEKEPTSGGTFHTWKNSKCKVKKHFCLNNL